MLDSRALWLALSIGALFSWTGPTGVALLAPSRAYAQGADDQVYRQTTDEAVREFAAGHWEEARALFKRAHELSPNARTLRGMGMAAFEMRMYVQAIRELDAALREQRKPLDADLRTQVQQLMEKAREFVGRVALVLQPPEAKPLIDGKEPEREPDGSVLLDVGTHVISATADGYKPTNLRLSVEGGMDQAVRVPLEPLLAVQQMVPAIDINQPPPPASEQATAPPARAPSTARAHESNNLGTYAIVALAGAGAFGVASAVFWFVGEGQYKDLKSSCAPNCSEQQIKDSGVKTSDLLTNLFLGVAAVGGLASGVLFAISAARSGEHDPLAFHAHPGGTLLSLRAGPTGAALSGRF